MFNRRRISELEESVGKLKTQVMSLRLDHLTINGDYKFKVCEEVEILKGKFKVQNRGYSDRSWALMGELIENLVPVYCLVGIDNEDVIYIEEAELRKEVSDFKSINERINRD